MSQEEITKSFPWIVSLFVHQDEMGGNTCGGSLVSPGVVLTAGHCVYNTDVKSLGVISAFAGPIPSPNTKPAATGKETFKTEHKVKSVLTYPGYPSPLDRDMGVVFLEDCVNVSSYAKVNADRSRDGKGKTATVLGWCNQFKGSMPHDPQPTGTHGDSLCLKKVSLPVHSGDDGYGTDCTKSSKTDADPGVVCMDVNPVGPAAGDSGGPLVMKDQDGSWTIIGTVSGGNPWPKGNTSHSQAIFMRVAAPGMPPSSPAKAAWIKEQIAKDHCKHRAIVV